MATTPRNTGWLEVVEFVSYTGAAMVNPRSPLVANASGCRVGWASRTKKNKRQKKVYNTTEWANKESSRREQKKKKKETGCKAWIYIQ